METIRGSGYQEPFPHLILRDFYNQNELKLIWQELNFYTQPGKLFEAKEKIEQIKFDESGNLVAEPSSIE